VIPAVGLIGEQGMIPCRTRADVINLSVGRILTRFVETAVRVCLEHRSESRPSENLLP